jgi:hypothetical protein
MRWESVDLIVGELQDSEFGKGTQAGRQLREQIVTKIHTGKTRVEGYLLWKA